MYSTVMKHITLTKITIHRKVAAIAKLSTNLNEFNIIGTLNSKNVKVGDWAELQHTFTQEDVNKFALICGDNNPLHLDYEFASKTIFQGPIVHGILVSSLFSTLFGRSITGSIYVSQTLQFKRPVHVSKPVTARIEILSIDPKKHGNLLTCSTICKLNETSKIVIEGKGEVLLPQ